MFGKLNHGKIKNDKITRWRTDLADIHSLARGLEVAKVQAQSYNHSQSLNAVVKESFSDSGGTVHANDYQDNNFVAAAPFGARFSCWFCGGSKPHASREACPAFNSTCTKCGILGHNSGVCRGGQSNSRGSSGRGNIRRNNQYRNSQNMTSSAVPYDYLAASPPCLSKSITKVLVNGRELDALVDSGSSATFLNHSSVQKHRWDISRGDHAPVSMASSTHVSHPVGHCTVDVHFNGELLSDQKIVVMKDLCADMIIGLDILSGYKSITLEYGGDKPPAIVSAAAHPIKIPKLFGRLEENCRPISIKSRRYSNSDKKFIKAEVKKLLEAGVIEECESPWRAQVLVHHGNENHKKRLVIDYSQTINRFTKLDAYPVPRIDEMVEDISKYKYFSTLDLSSAYHQIPIAEDEREYTAFEADGKLYCFLYIPFGVTNGVAGFQRTVDAIVAKENLSDVYVYVDNITIGGMTKEQHDKNLTEFLRSLGSQFTVITDQQSVSFMFGKLNHGKIKNDKITRWRIELSPYAFDIIHRPGKDNLPADALSRLVPTSRCSATIDLKSLHDQLCHPGITRMSHFVRSRNLPFSVEDIKKMTSSCRDCAEVKPRYFKPQEPQHLIKATAPFERLNLDFKGPLPSTTKNKFILTIVDEYSRYPFAFPCPDTSAESVKRCLTSIFGVFGMPSYIHSDQGSGFMASELKRWLLEKGIATSRSSRFNPEGNGQVEKYNGTVWKAVQLAIRTRKLQLNCWEQVITDVLHSIRSLLCTATNETPHERVFSFPRRSTSGSSLPAWLTDNSKALMKRHANRSKYDPIVEEVELLEVNPSTSHVRTEQGVEMTVSNKHLAPIGGDPLPHAYDNIVPTENVINEACDSNSEEVNHADGDNNIIDDVTDKPIRLIKPVICLRRENIDMSKTKPILRRSGRDRAPPAMYPLPDRTSSNNNNK